MTEHLSGVFLAAAVAPLHTAVADRLAGALPQAGTTHLVDLCSGSGGPLPAVLPLIEAQLGRAVTATLTDRYPNRHLPDAVATLPGALSVESAPVDARAVPASLPGLRTVFNAIHHFPPSVALRSTSATCAGGKWWIAIFEPFERRPRLALRLAAGALGGGWRDARRYRGPFLRAAALHVVLPLALSWDGAVSVLRAYEADELLAIAEGCGAGPGIAWRAERVELPWGAMTVLTGGPAAATGTSG